MTRPPLIGLCADSKLLEPHTFQCVGDKYIRAVAEGAGGLPLVVPVVIGAHDFEHLLDTLDGLVLPGSYANVHPAHYSDETPFEGSPLDPDRDRTTLALAPLAIRHRVPLLGICRGLQEMNVAFGGTLHQKVHEVSGYDDHRENDDDPLEVQYGEAHEVSITPGGLLATFFPHSSARVNSVHGQGIRDLAPDLMIEATAPDGLIEAFSVPAAKAFALAVQWHPEWRFEDNPLYTAIWHAFGHACRRRAAQRNPSNEESTWQPSAVN